MDTKKIRSVALLAAVLLAFGHAWSQNLVINGGFEQSADLAPVGWKVVDGHAVYYGPPPVKHNYTSATGFSKAAWTHPKSLFYFDGPHPDSGGCVTSINLAARHVCGTLVGQLSTPLEAGQRYLFSMHVASHTYYLDTVLSWFPVKIMGSEQEMALPDRQLRAVSAGNRPLRTANSVPPVRADTLGKGAWQVNILSHYDTSLVPVRNVPWIPVSVVFTARGGERLVVIGRTPDVDTFITPLLLPHRIPQTLTKEEDFIGNMHMFGLKGYQLTYLIDRVSLTPIAPPPPITAEPQRVEVLFAFASSDIQPESFPILQEWADRLAAQPEVAIVIHGHTDNAGAEAYNQALSLRRAEAVKAWLSAHGVAANRMACAAHGGSSPVADNQTMDGRRQNRRIEITRQP